MDQMIRRRLPKDCIKHVVSCSHRELRALWADDSGPWLDLHSALDDADCYCCLSNLNR